MKLLSIGARFAGALLAFLVLSSTVVMTTDLAFAQVSSSVLSTTVDSGVHIAWGDVIGQLGVDVLPWAGVVLLGLVIGLLPAPVRALLTSARTEQVDQLLERALGFAASTLQDKLKGQVLTLDLHNQILDKAVQYAIDHGSKAVLDFAGDKNNLAQKLAARVLTSPSVQAAQGALSPAFPSAVAK